MINDLNSGLVNFYRVLRDPVKFQKFAYLANLTPYSREEFKFCRATWHTCENDVEKAHRWFVVMRQSFAAVGDSFGLSVTAGGAVSGYLSAIQRLPEIHKRLRHVQIEHADFRKLIKTYDRPGTFFYLDPPYVLSTRKGKVYDHEMSDKDHARISRHPVAIKGKAMLSGYYANPIYERLEKQGWDDTTSRRRAPLLLNSPRTVRGRNWIEWSRCGSKAEMPIENSDKSKERKNSMANIEWLARIREIAGESAQGRIPREEDSLGKSLKRATAVVWRKSQFCF